MVECGTFLLSSDCYTIKLNKPFWDNTNNKINKNLKSFQFWTDNYAVHDRGIASQPLVLKGIKVLPSTEVQGFPLCFPICFNCACFSSFNFMHEIMDRHQEVTISGLGNCVDAVYVIKNFKVSTIPGCGSLALIWTLTLEKVRD